MKRRIAFASCLTVIALGANAASAQTGRVSLEGRGGFTLPQSGLKDGGASSGFSMGLDLMYNFHPRLTAYAGGSRDEFDGGYSSQGAQAGLKFLVLRDRALMPWLSAGAIAQKLNTDGANSDLSFGFEGGVGADLEVTPRFSLSPGAHFRSYNAGFGAGEIAARYFTFSLGAHLHLR